MQDHFIPVNLMQIGFIQWSHVSFTPCQNFTYSALFEIHGMKKGRDPGLEKNQDISLAFGQPALQFYLPEAILN